MLNGQTFPSTNDLLTKYPGRRRREDGAHDAGRVVHRRLGDARRPADHRHRARRAHRGGPRRRGDEPPRLGRSPSPDVRVAPDDRARRRAPVHARLRRGHAGLGAAAVVVGGGEAARRAQLLGGHGFGRRPPPRPAGVGGVERRRPPVRLVVRTAVAQGRQRRGEPAGHGRRRRHGRVPVGRGPGGAASRIRPDRTSGSSATWRSTRRWPRISAPTSCARTCSSSSCRSGLSAVIEREEEFATRATRWRFGPGSPETSSR